MEQDNYENSKILTALAYLKILADIVMVVGTVISGVMAVFHFASYCLRSKRKFGFEK